MIGYKLVNPNFFPILPMNVMSRDFYNSTMKQKIEYKGRNTVGVFMKVPIFVGNITIVTEFAVVENMDGYRDKEMRDVIIGNPFCKEVNIDAKRFEGFLSIRRSMLKTF